MIGLDTNVLARYLIEDAADTEAQRQREAARRLIESGESLFVPRTVVLELEWVMRGYYSFTGDQCARAMQSLLAMRQLHFEDRPMVELAVDRYATGMDFADALHHAACRACTLMATFDDRRFARRVRALKLAPGVGVPK
ncbi:MAG: type II toxin-antitoxin system VapC family toxin [Casimicrobiaceae bacterium]